jgi:lipoprotein-anchoring transpeptidase ErfK/SrfK
MSSTGRHASSSALGIPARLGVTTAVVGLLAVTVIIGAVAANSAGPGPTSAARSAASRARPAPAGPSALSVNAAPVARANAVPALTRLGHQRGGMARVAAPAHRATMPLVLTAADHRHCPATAAACVDLTRHLTWLQSNGKTTFGPIQMEPGKPGGGHETPRGTFWVQWKAGPSLISNIYHEPMPWATFFAAGGIAFHGGSLTQWSHGCVHLTVQNAHFYNEHLPIGAEVVVF